MIRRSVALHCKFEGCRLHVLVATIDHGPMTSDGGCITKRILGHEWINRNFVNSGHSPVARRECTKLKCSIGRNSSSRGLRCITGRLEKDVTPCEWGSTSLLDNPCNS